MISSQIFVWKNEHFTVPSPDSIQALIFICVRYILKAVKIVVYCIQEVNVFISFIYLSIDGISNLQTKIEWGPNVEEFQLRFDPESTNGEGPKRLRNLYFLYLLELRAISKAAPYLEQTLFYTGNDNEDAEVNTAILDLLNQIK